MPHRKNIIEDISLLYELALSMGRSLRVEDNAKSFLEILLSRKSLAFVSLWLRRPHQFELQFARPHFWVSRMHLPLDHLIWQRLTAENAEGTLSVVSSDPDFRQLAIHQALQSGCVTYYRIGDLGFIGLYDAQREVLCQPSEINQLKRVVEKFHHTLQGCLAYEELQRAKQKLSENEARFSKVIDTSPDAMIIIDAQGRVQEWNRQAEHLFGYTKAEILGNPLHNLALPDNIREQFAGSTEHLLESLDRAVTQQKRYELTGQHKSGRSFPMEVSVTSFEVEKNALFGLFLRDITERKEAEASLIHAKQVAEKARLAEQQFLANMSHEIRTPMNAVIGMTHLLYDTQPTEDQRDLLDSIKFSADTLMEILNNILDLSKIEAGELELDVRTFHLPTLLRSLHVSTELKLRNTSVKMVTQVDPRIQEYVRGDRTLLNQVLTNLLSNAVKFTDEGEVRLEVQVLKQTTDAYFLEFKVIDTGIGIPPEKQEMIFLDFKQVDSVETPKKAGTGLGLAIVKRLLSLMGSLIELDSTPGQGSTFSFQLKLPIHQTSQVLSAKGHAGEKPEKMAVDPALRGVRALVVEDNPMNQKLISRILESWKVRYEVANNGKEALKTMAKQPYDFVLMDLHMPQMDGIETTHHIRHWEGNPNQQVPIIALTAAAILDEKKAAIAAGMNDFMTKPFSPAMLEKMVEKWVRVSKQIPENYNNTMDNQPNKMYNLTYLEELSGGDQAFIGEMLYTFLEETEPMLEDLHRAQEEQDWEKVYQVTHKMKSSIKMLGMDEAARICEELELLARDPDPQSKAIREKAGDLSNRLRAIIPAIQEKWQSMKQA